MTSDELDMSKNVTQNHPIVLLLISTLCAILFSSCGETMAPEDYETATSTGGTIEERYLKHGSHEVSYFEVETTEKWSKYEVYYPAALKESDRKYPVLVMVNGSGVRGSRYTAVFRHYASWGFIVIGNEHDTSFAGDSADASLAYIIKQNEDPESVLYQKADLDRVGIVGHSQGGVGVFAAITAQPHSGMYRAAVSLSPVPEESAKAIRWGYDASKVKTPVMVLAGTENDCISLKQLSALYSHINSGKATARRSKTNHPEMLFSADGYVTAWFMWFLQDDKEAAKAFIGEKPELLTNPLYRDQKADLGSLALPNEAETEKIRGMGTKQ